MGYELYFDKAPTGRTHQVNNGGVIQNQAILGADGEPEQEYQLGAIVDGHRVPLQTFSIGYVEHMASRPDTAIDGEQDASSTAAPAEQQAQPTDQPQAPPSDQAAAGGEQQAQPTDQPAG